MIIVVKKSNIIMIALIFLLVIAIFSLNVGGEDHTVTVTKNKDVQKIVLLDPGHGGEDPGAVSDYSGVKEKDINLVIASKVKKLLEDDGYKVLMTREEDKLEYDPSTTNIVQKRKQDLLRRKKMMDEVGADVVVSIHLNKFGQKQYYGAQAFYPPGSAESQKLAVSIQKSLREMLDPDNSRQSLAQKDPMIILKNLKTATAIVECGFLSNPEEEKKLVQEEYQDEIAAAIAEGINEYFEI